MFDKFRAALLLAVGAVAVDDNCCTIYEGDRFDGTEATLCYKSMDVPSYFNILDHGIVDVGSFKCGKAVEYHICE